MNEEIEYKGCTIKVEPDENAQNPRTEWDNVTNMVFFHKRYGLGDTGTGYDQGDFKSWGELERQILADHKPVFIRPVFMLDHSGLSVRMGSGFFDVDPQGWDWGQIGFVYITRKDACECLGVKRIRTKKQQERLATIAKSDVEIYDDYLNGRCYGYIAEAADGTDIGSCWGFLGRDTSYLVEQAKEEIDYYLEEKTYET